jgi:hypothetical protein
MRITQGYTHYGFTKERDVTYRESSFLMGVISIKEIISTKDVGITLHIRTDETKFTDVFINGKRFIILE